jgi:hypothetical protein
MMFCYYLDLGCVLFQLDFGCSAMGGSGTMVRGRHKNGGMSVRCPTPERDEQSTTPVKLF